MKKPKATLSTLSRGSARCLKRDYKRLKLMLAELTSRIRRIDADMDFVRARIVDRGGKP